MEITTAIKTAKEIHDTLKKVQQVHDVTKQLKNVSESEGKDQIMATKDLAETTAKLKKENNISKSESKAKKQETKESFIEKPSGFYDPPLKQPSDFIDDLPEVFSELPLDELGQPSDFIDEIPNISLEPLSEELEQPSDFIDESKDINEPEKEQEYTMLDKDEIPPNKHYSNLENKTIGELLKDIGLTEEDDLKVFYDKETGEPIFDKDGGTKDGKPLQTVFEEGIGEHLNGKDREQLHNRAFEKLAKQQGVSVDEIKVFKGDAEPVQRLMNKWECSEQEVWERCGNPNKAQRVLHECMDGKTVQLVPRVYHDNIPHKGGVHAVTSKNK